MMLTHGLRILTAFMLAFHAAEALVGPGHHALDGIIGCLAPQEDGSAAHPHDSSETSMRADKDCSACNFFSLASLSKLFAPPMIRLVAERAPNDLDWLRPSNPLPITSSPRAPPRLAA